MSVGVVVVLSILCCGLMLAVYWPAVDDPDARRPRQPPRG